MTAKRDFLTLSDLTPTEHLQLFMRAAELKRVHKKRTQVRTLDGRVLVLLFEKNSTRTRLSFASAISQLGGAAVELPPADSQLPRGESLSDTGRAVGLFADAVVMRTYGDPRLQEFARACGVPVINGLSDGGHPVQLLADMFTVHERLGQVEGKTIAFVGDSGSNMGRSYVEASGIFGFRLKLGSPAEHRPTGKLGSTVSVHDTAEEAAAGADVVVTDVWTSMGQDAEAAARKRSLLPFQVNEALMSRAANGAIFLHCLPAHRGEEVTAAVLEGPRSAVWAQAENHFHTVKALLEKLMV